MHRSMSLQGVGRASAAQRAAHAVPGHLRRACRPRAPAPRPSERLTPSKKALPAILSNPLRGFSSHRGPPMKSPAMAGLFILAERVGFEPTCRFYPTIRFRIGAVMTASVPLRLPHRAQPAAALRMSDWTKTLANT